jgi:hypothetical protein
MIDEGMADDALERIAEREEQDVSATWQAIRADLRKAGPFSKMILSFRESATAALVDLVFVETKEPAVAKLQNEVRRYLSTMEIIHGYRDGAAAVDANAEANDVSDDDREFLTQIEDPDD